MPVPTVDEKGQLVTCPVCGDPRVVSRRHWRRIDSGQCSSICRLCSAWGHGHKRGILAELELPSREELECWWLILFGCELDGHTPAEYLADHDLPEELAEMLRGLFGRRETWGRFS